MSSTTGNRIDNDDYPTPPWVVQRLLEAVALPGGHWIEPAAGAGQIITTVNQRDDIKWSAVELQRRHERALQRVLPHGLYEVADFLEVAPDLIHNAKQGIDFNVAITNPPYSLAFDFVERMRQMADWVIVLLRIGWLEGGASKATAARAAFLAQNFPDVYILPNRPPFAKSKTTGKWGTDSATYAWMVWPPEKRTEKQGGKVCRLAVTPKEVRRAWLDLQRERDAA